MTREIKFRFWDKAQGKFTDYGAIHLSGSIMTYSQTFGGMYDFVGDELEKNIVVQQYTGLKDKKGVEIYEGDLVRHSLRATPLPVGFSEGSFVYIDDKAGLSISCDVWEEREVIGNIYENPELLEANK